MISIIINNQRADYFGSLTIKKDNPMFSPIGIEPIEHTYTLTLPTTATNVKIFSLIQHTFATPQKLPARIEVDGVQVLEGSCNVQSWSESESGYSVYFSGVAEDANASPIKKMLADTRTMYDLLKDDVQEFVNLTADNYVGIRSKYNNTPAIVSGYTYRYYSPTNTELTPDMANVGYCVKYLLEKIVEKYGITISNLLNNFQNYFIIRGSEPRIERFVFEGYNVQHLYLADGLPTLTAKQIIESACALIGAKLNIDYSTSTITFERLSGTKNPQALNAELNSINWQEVLTSLPKITFDHIEPLVIEDEESGNKTSYPYSQEVSVAFGEKENKIPIAFPIVSSGIIGNSIISPMTSQNADKHIICGFKGSTAEIGESVYRMTPANLSFDDTYMQWWRDVQNKNVALKFKAKLHPLQFSHFNYFKPININGIPPFFVKSISFNANGESDIEGYLY